MSWLDESEQNKLHQMNALTRQVKSKTLTKRIKSKTLTKQVKVDNVTCVDQKSRLLDEPSQWSD